MKVEWFPAAESANVVGRVVEIEKLHPKMSEDKGEPVYILVPAMEAKVIKESADISHQELKPHNREQICKRFPGAWEAYQKRKAAEAAEKARPVSNEPEVLPSIGGTPLDKATFIPRTQLARLKTIGFSTVEQIAGLTDEQMQSLGGNARAWRKKAGEFLKG